MLVCLSVGNEHVQTEALWLGFVLSYRLDEECPLAYR